MFKNNLLIFVKAFLIFVSVGKKECLYTCHASHFGFFLFRINLPYLANVPGRRQAKTIANSSIGLILRRQKDDEKI